MTAIRRFLPALLLVVSAAAGASAPAGTAQNFLDRVHTLKSRGPMALFSGDIGKLKAEANAAGRSIEADRIASDSARRAPAYCSPKPKVPLGQSEFLAGLERIPAGQRATMPLKQAMLRVIQAKYPCGARRA